MIKTELKEIALSSDYPKKNQNSKKNSFKKTTPSALAARSAAFLWW